MRRRRASRRSSAGICSATRAAPARRCRTRIATSATSSSGLNYGEAIHGRSRVRGWDGRQIEAQRSDSVPARRRRARWKTRASPRRFPATIGAPRRCGRKNNIGMLESFSVGGDFRHYQGDFNEVDFNTAGCATNVTATCHTQARTVSSGGSQSLSGVFVQAILAPVDAAPHRAERARRSLGQQRRALDRQHAAVDDRTTRRATATAARTAFSPRAGIRYQVILVALVPRRVLSRVPRAEPRRALSQAGEHDVDHDPEPVPQGGERRGTRGGLRLAADRLDPGEGHVLRRGLQQLQRPDEPHGDVDAARRPCAAPSPRAARG